jgi:curved DNA-binding protein CbpA
MFKLSDTHFFQLKKEFSIEKMHNLFPDSNEAAVTEEDVIQNVQSTDVKLQLIKINKGNEEKFKSINCAYEILSDETKR